MAACHSVDSCCALSPVADLTASSALPSVAPARSRRGIACSPNRPVGPHPTTTSDGACAAPAVSSVEVFGDEDDQTPIARNEVYSPDAAAIGVGTLRLRAERR